MTQYDLILTQNVHATGTEFSEKLVNLTKGDILSAAGATKVPTVLAVGTNGYMLVADSAEAIGLKWQVQPTLPTITSLGAQTVNNLSSNIAGDYVDFNTSITKYPSVKAIKDYADGLLAANDAMIFKGTVGTGGTLTIVEFEALTTYSAGWTYKFITACTTKGIVLEVGDMMTAIVDRAGTGVAYEDWTAWQGNTDGIVVGPANSTTGNVALFNGATGKIISDAGFLGTDVMLKSMFATANRLAVSNGAGSVTTKSALELFGLMTDNVTPPTAFDSAGTIDYVAFDGNYLYICTASGPSGTGRWARVAMATTW